MKKNRLSFAATALLSAGAILAAGAACAEDLPQTKARQEFSAKHGLSASSLAVLQRADAADQNQVSAALIAKLRPSGAHRSANVAGTLRTTGEQWSLEVLNGGAAAEYRDLAVEARAHSLGRPLSEEMPAAELEQKGRAFIASQLASQIVLGPDETLVALRADYRTEGGQDLATRQISSAVVANRIVFGRVIGGVPVVGNGSKVILTFTNDGALESFRYDWPLYKVAASQNIVDAAEILARVQKVNGVRNGVVASTAAVAVPAGGSKVYPLALTPNTELQAMECGYYDPGSYGHKIQSVQPGCTYLTVAHDASGMRAGYAGAVPAGASFAVDGGWLETQILGAR